VYTQVSCVYAGLLYKSLLCIPQTAEIGLKIITTVKISNKFSRGIPLTYQTRFHGSPRIFIQVSWCVNEVPATQKIQRSNRLISSCKYFKSDLLREWIHVSFTGLFCVYTGLFYRTLLCIHRSLLQDSFVYICRPLLQVIFAYI